jgi:hypothetical protein
MPLVPIPGTTLVRDTNGMALINTDRNGLEDYNLKRRLLSTQKEEINKVKDEIDSMRSDLDEIKQLMLKILNKGTNG